MTITLKSPAKLNLSLKIFKPRENGYHPLESIFQTLTLSDTLTIDTHTQKSLEITCSANNVPTDKTNTLHKVYNLLNCQKGYKVHIEKNIPLGGGLGGGSSNAATFLTFLNKNESLNLSLEKQIELASKIGSDIPFFLYGKTALVSGIGEKIHPIPTKKQYYLLIFPQIHCDTKIVYTHFDTLNPNAPEETQNPPLMPQNYIGKNDLLDPALQAYPELKKALKELNNYPWQLSGSGSTLFIPFQTKEEANRAETHLKSKAYPYPILQTESE